MSYLSEALSDGPLALWMLEETAGTVAADSSGNGRDLTINGAVTKGATKVMPSSSSSFSFPNATTAHLTRASEAWMQVPSYTITAWVNAVSLASYRAIWSRDSAGTRGPSFYANGGKLNLFVTSDSNGTGTLSTATNYFVAATYDSASSTLRYYINGVLDATFTAISKPNNGANAIYVGTSFAGSGALNFPWEGRIGPVGYYGTALSGARLLAQYNAGIDTSPVLDAGAVSFTALDVTVPVVTDTSNKLEGFQLGGYVMNEAPDPLIAELPPIWTPTRSDDMALYLPPPTIVDGRIQ